MADARIEIHEALTAPAIADSVPLKTKSRERLAWSVAAIFLIIAVTISAFTFFRRAADVMPVVRFLVSPPDDWRLTLEPLAVSPDGLRVAFSAMSADGQSLLWVRSLDSLAAQSLPGTDGAEYAFWSPDSRFIGFFADNKLKKIDVLGGPPITLCDALALGGAWNQEGVILFNVRGSEVLHKVSASGGVPTAVTALDNGETSHRQPFFMPDGRHFLYRAITTPVTTLVPFYLGSLDSAERKLLLNANGVRVVYSREHLLFMRERTLMAQPFDARRLELTGEAFPVADQLQTYLNPPTGLFSASENGVLAYRTGGSSAEPPTQLVWLDRAGKNLGVLGEPGVYFMPRLSPDGEKLAVEQHNAQRWGDMQIFDVMRGTRTRFTFHPSHNSFPVWSPDGSQLAFHSTPRNGTNIYVKALAGSKPEELLLQSTAAGSTDWSRDGRYIIYDLHRNSKTGSDIWMLPLMGDRKPQPLIQTSFDEMHGQLSPDGRWLAYASNESSTLEVYVSPFPPTGAKWQVSNSGGDTPRWRRDGKELFYLGADQTMTAVPVTTGGTFEAAKPIGLFKSSIPRLGITGFWYYDVSADGQRFVAIVPLRETDLAPITVLVNWTSALRR